eukprot:4464179-Ditylum_brightwellii.AAC.1
MGQKIGHLVVKEVEKNPVEHIVCRPGWFNDHQEKKATQECQEEEEEAHHSVFLHDRSSDIIKMETAEKNPKC